MPVIEVALATCDSENFLPPLLDSLFAQTCQEFAILVADDASTDRTLDIVDGYSARNPGRIRVVARRERRLGPLGNFAGLFDCARADYVMPCDHDDVWLPGKIAMTLDRMRALERDRPPGTPLLVHTDLTVVDADLQVLQPSFFRFSGVDPAQNGVLDLLCRNVATGCAMMVNRPLYTRARPIPAEAVMHDHWLALIAAATGAISYIQESTILYRQHAGNAIGARPAGTVSVLEGMRETLFTDGRQRVLLSYSQQAAALLDAVGGELDGEARQAAEALATLWSTRAWRRFSHLRRVGIGLGGVGFIGVLRTIALWITVTRRRRPASRRLA